MNSQGLTFFELIISLAILAIVLAIGIPSFNAQISQSRTKTATLTLLDAIETTRSIAVFRNMRTVLLAKDKKWHMGWTLFSDYNNNGLVDGNDQILAENGPLKGVFATGRETKEPMPYISFIGTGEGKKIANSHGGAFLAGTIQICPEQKGDGYALVLSKGGRTRVEKVKAAKCGSRR
ncbi:MAG TPA: GspH/FimT family pseudopilin [Cellvibrio sp.]|nr:GspH/FimT family pseudopilin [Cellvibrio sp.]